MSQGPTTEWLLAQCQEDLRIARDSAKPALAFAKQCQDERDALRAANAKLQAVADAAWHASSCGHVDEQLQPLPPCGHCARCHLATALSALDDAAPVPPVPEPGKL